MNATGSVERPIALVTGASRGIGAAIALALARSGFDIAAMAIDAADETVAAVEATGARAVALQGDLGEVTEHAAMIDAVRAWGNRGIACLVNNAGIGSPRRGDLLEVDADAYDKVLGTNLRGTFFLTQAVARHMLATETLVRRSIVTISSVSAEAASIERGEYCVSKAGLGMVTKLFALRLAPLGIGVFEVRPGIIQTAMTAGVADKYDKVIADGLVPMRRWGTPEDIADVVASLAGGQFVFATGSVIHVDGALSIPRF